MSEQPNSSQPLARLRDVVEKRIVLFGGDQSGAVAIACLAACLILFMTALVLHDAGNSARTKLDVQNAADTAAYSQAAVKARTMNMVAYTNVAKRTIISLHNTYVGLLAGWVAWTALRCAKCSKWNWKACWDCFINGLLAIAELPDTLNATIGSAKNYYQDEIEALDKYQAYMTQLTPWWAWSEGTVRGARNGATFTSSFPPPPGLLLTYVSDWLEAALGFFGVAPLYNQTDKVDAMPLKRGWAIKMCAPTTMAGIAEATYNVWVHKSRSKEGAKKGAAIAMGIPMIPTVGCASSLFNFAGYMRPREPVADGNSAESLMAKSNIVFSYKHAPENRGKFRTNYNIGGSDYTPSVTNPYFRGSGFWTLARGEFFFDGGSPDPWKPRWTAKIRPVAMPGEFEELDADLNAMFHDIAPYMAIIIKLNITKGAL
ncbi:MAG: Tad domain-containing protein, partial [Bradymonadaceae bacterium]